MTMLFDKLRSARQKATYITALLADTDPTCVAMAYGEASELHRLLEGIVDAQRQIALTKTPTEVFDSGEIRYGTGSITAHYPTRR